MIGDPGYLEHGSVVPGEKRETGDFRPIMLSTDIELDEMHDPIVAVLRPRWRTVRRTIFRLFLALMWSAAGAYYLRELLIHHSTVGNHRLFYALFTGVFFSLALINLYILRIAWKRPFAIVHAGIEVLGQTLPWEKTVSCRWNHYSPGTLMIKTHLEKADGHLSVPVPETHRTLVEETLRRFGKWDGAQPESPLA